MSTPRTDAAPRLVVDTRSKSPKPLDRRIASVSLRTTTNNPTEGYDLSLSASFGRERVTLTAPGFEIDVAFSLTTADVDLSFHNCTYSLLESDQAKQAEGWNTAMTEGATTRLLKKSDGSIGVEGKIIHPPRVAARVHVGGQHTFESRTVSAITTRKQIARDWYLMNSDAIKIGRSGKILDGPLIGDFKGWHVKPRPEESSVTARVRVRENWINFEDAQYVKAPRTLREKLRALLHLTPERSRRRELFLVLLRHLAQTELREHQNDKEAAIAVAQLVVRPGEDYATAIPTMEGRSAIAIPGPPLEEYLHSEEGHEASTLIALGVRRDLIPSDPQGRLKEVPGATKVFVPTSPADQVARVFSQIQASVSGPIGELSIAANELRDLCALGLVTVRSHRFQLRASTGEKSESDFRRCASEAPSIKVARAVLRINPLASAMDIADAVSLELGANWSKKSTRQRNGRSIGEWAIWLEPDLSPSTSRDGFQHIPGVRPPAVPEAPDAAEHQTRDLLPASMRVWSIVNPKGGSGKTTLTVQLAVAAAKNSSVLVVDLDPQRSASSWARALRRRQGSNENPRVLAASYQRLTKMLKAARNQGVELVLIDTPARLDKAIMTALKTASMVLVPSKITPFDLAALRDCVDLLALANARTKAVIILTAVRTSLMGAPIEDMSRLAAQYELEVMSAYLSDLDAFHESLVWGSGVTETEKNGTAAKQITALLEVLWNRESGT